MSLQETTTELNKLLSLLKTEVALETAASFADIKTVLCERILLEPLKLALDVPDLVSLNAAEKSNFPAIDLADDVARVAIQVTNTSAVEKIKSTLEKYRRHGLHTKYDRLYILLLSDKKKYKADFTKSTQSAFEFELKDILDLGDVYKLLVNNVELYALNQIARHLRSHLVGSNILDSIRQQATQTDILHLNLLPMVVPDSVCLARLVIDKKAVRELKLQRRLRSDRDYAMALLSYHGVDFPRDFICHDGSLVSFRSLAGHGLGGIGLIDEGSVESVDTESFYRGSLDYEIQFRFLLRQTLLLELNKHEIFWQNEEHFFAFGPLEKGVDRVEHWMGKVSATRKVYNQLKSDDPERKPIYKHFAFRTQFKLIDDVWYLVAEPKWLFSWDGYRKSWNHPKLAAAQAQHEKNQSIYSHTRFLSWYLSSVFSTEKSAISIGKNLVVLGESTISDIDWKQENATS